jgi:hypothetical protein
VTYSALLNRNNDISADPQQRTKELQDKSVSLIAKSHALRLRAGELINQSQWMRIGVLRMHRFRSRGREALSELYCQKFELSEAAARYESSLIDGYPSGE